MRNLSSILVLALSACTAPGGPYPSLQPRAAETIDPRVPVRRAENSRPVRAALAARLGSLVSDARRGDAAFATAILLAEHLASVAGARQSESWIAAEEALTAAIAARRQTASALADIDELGASALQTQGGVAPSELIAIDSAAAEVAAVFGQQARRVALIQKRLDR